MLVWLGLYKLSCVLLGRLIRSHLVYLRMLAFHGLLEIGFIPPSRYVPLNLFPPTSFVLLISFRLLLLDNWQLGNTHVLLCILRTGGYSLLDGVGLGLAWSWF